MPGLHVVATVPNGARASSGTGPAIKSAVLFFSGGLYLWTPAWWSNAILQKRFYKTAYKIWQKCMLYYMYTKLEVKGILLNQVFGWEFLLSCILADSPCSLLLITPIFFITTVEFRSIQYVRKHGIYTYSLGDCVLLIYIFSLQTLIKTLPCTRWLMLACMI